MAFFYMDIDYMRRITQRSIMPYWQHFNEDTAYMPIISPFELCVMVLREWRIWRNNSSNIFMWMNGYGPLCAHTEIEHRKFRPLLYKMNLTLPVILYKSQVEFECSLI